VEPEPSAGDPVGEPVLAEGLDAALAAAPAPAKQHGRGGAHAVKVAAGILLSRVAGFAREAISGYFFGVSAWADVYSTAMRMPNLLQNLLGDQALSASFIPFYSKMLAEKRDEDARRFAGAILGLLLMAAGGLALLGVVFARPIVAVTAPGFVHDAQKVAAHTLAVDRYALTVQQVRVLFPMAGLLVLSAWALAVLNSHRRFFLPYAAPVLWNLSIIATFVLVGRRRGGAHLGPLAKSELLYAAAWGALVGGALQLAIQLPTVLRLLGGLEVSFGTRARGVRDALRAFGPVVAGRGALQLSGYLDYVLASMAAAGAASAFRYAYALFLLPVGLFATSVAVTELPEVSRLKTDEERARRVEWAWRQISFLSLPAVVGFLAFGSLVVGLAFVRGAFGRQEQYLVTLVLASFTIGLLPATNSRLLQNLFYALHETRYPARLAVMRVVVSVVAGGALMFALDRVNVSQLVTAPFRDHELHLGAVGLGLGTSLGAWLELLLLARGARRRVPELHLPWAAMLRTAALAGGAALLAGGVWRLLDHGGARLYLVASVVLGAFTAAYLGGAAALRFPELKTWLRRT
jgi:putative peptidoglycan lipid II flippase